MPYHTGHKSSRNHSIWRKDLTSPAKQVTSHDLVSSGVTTPPGDPTDLVTRVTTHDTSKQHSGQSGFMVSVRLLHTPVEYPHSISSTKAIRPRFPAPRVCEEVKPRRAALHISHICDLLTFVIHRIAAFTVPTSNQVSMHVLSFGCVVV